MNITEISPKFWKTNQNIIIRITPKTNQHMLHGRVFPLNQTSNKSIKRFKRHKILAAILDFVEKAKKKDFRANMHTEYI